MVDVRVFSMPEVVFHTFMVDSAQFDSQQAVPGSGPGISETLSGNTFIRSTVRTWDGHDAVRILLTPACAIRLPGQPQGAACWKESVSLPERGGFKVKSGFSGTTVPRLALRSTLAAGNQTIFGSRSAAVQGNLDRSAIEAWTAVPQPYIAAGLESAGALDFRGLIHVDWQHDATFTAPNATQVSNDGHVRPDVRTDWTFQDNGQYFADWMTDELVLKTRMSGVPSFCTLREQLFATPLTFEVFGAGVSGSRLLLDSEVMTAGQVDPSGHFRVSSVQTAAGNFRRALTP